jgi:hypothetical protein
LIPNGPDEIIPPKNRLRPAGGSFVYSPMKRHTTLPLLILFTLVVSQALYNPLPAQSFTIAGTVRDATNGRPLPAANIRIGGTSKGTISNEQGEYRLSLEQGSYVLLFSYIGYKTDSIHVLADRKLERDVSLQPIPIMMKEMVVTDEDPAYGIMRKVIENKSRWAEVLRSYQFEAFTRQALRRDTSIASISESYTTGYWQRGDTLREIIRQKRQTANIASQSGAAAVGGIVNFYDDEVRIAGFRFVGPTARDAFDYYDFKLTDTRMKDGVVIYVITMIPKSRITPLFNGTISIAGDTYAVAGVEVTPNEAFTIPFVNQFEYHYAQQFALYEEQYWMPTDIRIKGWFSINLIGFTFPRIGIDQVSSIYEYRINTEIPDSIFHKPRRIMTKEAEKFDSTYWAKHEVLPLTVEEKTAYEKLDSSQTLDKQFQPGGAASVLSFLTQSSFRFIDVHFNRVDGLFLGVDAGVDSLSNSLRGWAAAGYGTSDKRWKGKAGAELFFDTRRRWSVGAEYRNGIDHFPDENFYPTGSITLMTLLDKEDYRDYFYREGWEMFAAARPATLLSVRFGIQHETQRTATQTTDYSFFNRSVRYRLNPGVAEGTLSSFVFSARYGQRNAIPLQLVAQSYVELELEHSTPSFLNSDFNFTRLMFRGEYNIQTYGRRLFFAPTLYLRLAAGNSWGSLPPQRVFMLESRGSGTAPFGSLKTADPRQYGGDSFVILSVEHNFRSTPFLALNIPFLYRNSTELLLYGSVARTWNRNPSLALPGQATSGWYSEAGISIGRIFGLFRIDYTERFSHSRTGFITVGVSRIL